MSTRDGGGFDRPKISDMLKSAFAPRQPIDVDPDAPNPIPRAVKIGGGLIVGSGALNLVMGLFTLFQRSSIVEGQVTEYNKIVDVCRTNPADLGSLVDIGSQDPAQLCTQVAPLTADQINSALSNLLLIGAVLTVVGLASVVAGAGVFRGVRWARWLALGLGAALMISTFLNLVQSLLTFAATVLAVIGLTLLFVGKGANYFIRAKAQGTR